MTPCWQSRSMMHVHVLHRVHRFDCAPCLLLVVVCFFFSRSALWAKHTDAESRNKAHRQQRQAIKTKHAILCLSAQYNIQKCVRILTYVYVWSLFVVYTIMNIAMRYYCMYVSQITLHLPPELFHRETLVDSPHRGEHFYSHKFRLCLRLINRMYP